MVTRRGVSCGARWPVECVEMLVAGVDRIHHLGPVLGNVCFAVLPLVEAFVATSPLHHDD